MPETMERSPVTKTYVDLRREVRSAIARGKQRAANAVEQENVRTALEIGQLIHAHILQSKRADYAQKILPRLAKDLNLGRSELYYMLEFARTYPIVRSNGQLSWAHHKRLLAINDPEDRRTLALKAEKERWSTDQLRREIQKLKLTKTGIQDGRFVPKILSAEPGIVGCYRMIRAAEGPYPGELAIDLGFSNYFRPHKLSFKEGDIVEYRAGKIIKRKDGAESDLFTYQVYPFHIIDGDTFTAVIDLGFGVTSVQTLRLRAIDAPEIQSQDGRAAKIFFELSLRGGRKPTKQSKIEIATPPSGARNDGDRNVLIKSTKSDKYDRYLADVFVDGVYLNQQLAARGLVNVVET